MSTASESCDTTSQMSLFGETCEPSTVRLWPTPSVQNGKHAAATDWEQEHRPNHLHVLASASSPQAIPASHSHSPGSDWARRMTATYGRKLGAYWLSCDPPDSWVRTLLGISTWVSTTCYLTWKKSVTPAGRLLFRLVPSTPPIGATGFGLWGTPTSRDHKDTGNMENVPVNGLLGHQVLMPTPRVEGFDAGKHRGKPDSLHSFAKMWPTPQAHDAQGPPGRAAQERGGFNASLSAETRTTGLKLNSAWVSRMMGYPDSWLTLDGEATP
jgi:hypothetical protein